MHRSKEAWHQIVRRFDATTLDPQEPISWTCLPLLVFRSLTVNWPEYVSALHGPAECLVSCLKRFEGTEKLTNGKRRDVSFTEPAIPGVDNADATSLQNCFNLMDALSLAAHALAPNITVLTAFSAQLGLERGKLN